MSNILKCNGTAVLSLVLILLTTCQNGSGSKSELKDLNNSSKSLCTDKKLSSVIDRIIQEEAAILPDSLIGSGKLFFGKLDSATKVILSEKLNDDDPLRNLDKLKDLVFNKWNIRFQPTPDKLQSVFPHLAFNNREGSCLSISLIFLLLGENLNLPLNGVLAPGHFFLRYDDGTTRLNIETLRKGEYMSDSWYKSRYLITDTTLYDLADLDIPAVEASIRYNLGNFYLANNWPDLALKQFNLAIELNPSFIEAHGNRAIALDVTGNPDAALRSLLRLKKHYPQLTYLNKNLGALYIKRKNYPKAINEYQVALSSVPSDTEALYGLGISYFFSDQIDKASEVFRELLRISPEHYEGHQILGRLQRTH